METRLQFFKRIIQEQKERKEFDTVYQAAKHRDLACLKSLVSNGGSVNVLENGLTPLTKLMFEGDLQAANWLVEKMGARFHQFIS